MSPRLPQVVFAVGVALLATASVRAQPATVSPFMPPPAARSAEAPTANAPLELRGIAELPGGTAFRVVDPARKAGAWVKLNEPDSELGVVVKQHNAAQETVVVEYQGRTLTLPLHQSKVASSGAAMPNPVNLVMPPPAALAPTPPAPSALAAQQAQMDAVAAAVAQRRALREQAQQQIQQGVPVVMPPAQPPARGANGAQSIQNGATNASGQNGRSGQTNQRTPGAKNRPGQP
jgi:hypothetical protein